MAGERSSTTRARLAGKICCKCRITLPQPWPGRERFCASCDPASRRVLMTFFLREGWVVQFLESDCRTPIGRIRTYPENAEATVRAIAERGHALTSPEEHSKFQTDIQRGRGSASLILTPEQYDRLRRSR